MSPDAESDVRTNGVAVAPHALAAQSALAVLREGGNAIEAMVAAAATIAVVYPHMNSIGGDGFWLDPAARCGSDRDRRLRPLRQARDHRVSIESAGCRRFQCAARSRRTPSPARSAGGTKALSVSQRRAEQSRSDALLADAIGYAHDGIPVTRSQHASTKAKLAELKDQPGFARCYLVDGEAPHTGIALPAARAWPHFLAAGRRGAWTLSTAGRWPATWRVSSPRLAHPSLSQDLQEQRASHVVRRCTFQHRPRRRVQPAAADAGPGVADDPRDARSPRARRIAGGDAGLRPPGCRSDQAAFEVRDRYITDPARFEDRSASVAAGPRCSVGARRKDRSKRPPPVGHSHQAGRHDLDGRDRPQRAGGVVHSEHVPRVRQRRRGGRHRGRLAESRRIVPARAGPSAGVAAAEEAIPHAESGRPRASRTAARWCTDDGRGRSAADTGDDLYALRVVWPDCAAGGYGTALAARAGPGAKPSDTLKLESRFDPAVVAALQAKGHDIELIGAFDESVGHAGMAVRHPDGIFEAAADPRSDGAVAGF